MANQLLKLRRHHRDLVDREYIAQSFCPSGIRRFSPSNLIRQIAEVLLVIARCCQTSERRMGYLFSCRRKKQDGIRLYLGCGIKRLDGFINVDGRMTDATDRVMNILDLDFPPSTVDEIYTCHMIEHFTPQQLDAALCNWFDILKPGGLLTVRCPNFNFVLDSYFLNNSEQERWKYLPNIFGPTSHGPNPYHQHRNAFSVLRLRSILEEHGFSVAECRTCPTRDNTGEEEDIFCLAQRPEQQEA